MSFSERMCSCCLVSTMCRFFRIFMAKVLFSSLLSWTCSQEERKICKYMRLVWTFTCNCKEKKSNNVSHTAVPPTSSTRPNPPTPRVSMMLKSARLRLKKNAFSASYLASREKQNNYGNRIRDDMKDERRDNPLSTNWDQISVCASAHLFANLRELNSSNLSRIFWRM